MRRCEQWAFLGDGGQEIFYRYWPAMKEGLPIEPAATAAILLHRGHEHSGRLQYLVDELELPECAMFAWDARGHGRTPGKRGAAPSMGAMVKDLDLFAHHIVARHGVPVDRMVLVAQSVGSVLAACWVHDYAPRLRAMVLAAPAFRIKLYVPFARLALSIWHRICGDFTVKSYVRAHYLTHDKDRIQEFNTDPLITRSISARALLDLFSYSRRIVQDAQAIQIPTQVLVSGSDWVVDVSPQREFFQKLGSARKELHVFPGFYHDTLGELDRRRPLAHVRRFLREAWEQPEGNLELNTGDPYGFTQREYERLRQPLPRFSVKRIAFALQRMALRIGGRLSGGIRLGRERGFDSGASLDYVYRNQPSGCGALGRLVDRVYLNSLGWRGIRVRRANLERQIDRGITEIRERQRPVRVLDIASGQGRYLLEAVDRQRHSVDAVLLRDICPLNVDAGSRMIDAKGLSGLVRFERADAFDRASFLALKGRYSVAVVSGFYELFPENDRVKDSLAGLAEAVEPNGYLIYTGQPWHPQLELIARTLPSHKDHKPWVMRRRSQAELDELVEDAGFRKVCQLIDQWGIFTVSLAQRVVNG